MRIDHITHRSLGHLADRAIQCLPFRETTAGIDYRNTAIADDKANVGNLITFKYDCGMSGPYVNACSDLHNPG